MSPIKQASANFVKVADAEEFLKRVREGTQSLRDRVSPPEESGSWLGALGGALGGGAAGSVAGAGVGEGFARHFTRNNRIGEGLVDGAQFLGEVSDDEAKDLKKLLQWRVISGPQNAGELEDFLQMMRNKPDDPVDLLVGPKGRALRRIVLRGRGALIPAGLAVGGLGGLAAGAYAGY